VNLLTFTFVLLGKPVTVVTKAMSRGGNPTGQVRKLKNVGVAVHNTMEKWETLNSKGSSVIGDISNLKLEHLFAYNDDEDESSRLASELQVSVAVSKDFAVEGSTSSVGAKSGRQSKSVNPELENKCEKLHDVCKSMEEVVTKLAAQVSIVRGLRSLSQHSDGDASFDSAATVFELDDLVETLDSLYAMCIKELSLKQNVARTVVHAPNRELLMTYCAMWTHQPYLDSKMLLDSVLLMTGNKIAASSEKQ
jgi:hypothetical protein